MKRTEKMSNKQSNKKWTTVGRVQEAYFKNGQLSSKSEGGERSLSINWNPRYEIIDKKTKKPIKVDSVSLFKFDLDKELESDTLPDEVRDYLNKYGESLLYNVTIGTKTE